MNGDLKPLVVTTSFRGVFFGYGTPTESKTIRLERARMCIKWPPEQRGVIGLAADGPKAGAKVGPACPAITIQEVTAVMEATEEAAARWEKAPW